MKKKQAENKPRSNKRNRKFQANSNNSSYGNFRGSFSGFGFPRSGSMNTTYNVAAQAGYPDIVGFEQLWWAGTKNPIGKAGIHRIVDKCWQTHPTVTDGPMAEGRELTDFEKDLKILIEKHKFFTRLKGADWRQRIGRYSVILPIIKEQNPSQPDKPITKVKGIEALIKLVPKNEAEVDVTDISTVSDINSEFYGDPLYYNLRQDVAGDRNPIDNKQERIHPTRLIPYAEGADDGSIFGIPVNEAGFNNLINLESIGASSAITMKKNAQQRFISNIENGQVASTIAKDGSPENKAYNQNVDDFDKGVKNNLTLYGMSVYTLQTTLADPTNPFTIETTAYCASINNPVSELFGLQMNEQASASNSKAFNKTAKSRRENFINPEMIMKSLEYFIDVGVLRAPANEILIEWDDLDEDSDTEKLVNGKTMMEINKLARESGSSEAVYSNEEVRKKTDFDVIAEGDVELFGEDDDLVKDTPNA